MALIETHFCSHSDEADLVTRLRARRPKAFEELLDLYQQPIYSFVHRLLDDISEAPDVTQEVFIKVFRKIGSFRRECSLKTWIYRIAMNEVSNRRRWFSRHRRREASMDAIDEQNGWHAEVFADQGASPFDRTYQQEQMALIERCLKDIDPRLRAAVVLRDIQELSYNEIAGVMQVSLGTVKSRILRGREALKLRLERELPALAPEACAFQTE